MTPRIGASSSAEFYGGHNRSGPFPFVRAARPWSFHCLRFKPEKSELRESRLKGPCHPRHVAVLDAKPFGWRVDVGVGPPPRSG